MTPQQRYYRKHRREILDSVAKLRKTEPRYRLSMYKENAKRRGLEWALSAVEFEALVRQPCHYCGLEASPLNGLDRMDNNLGYTTENVTACCTLCNWGKGDGLTPDQYVQHCRRVAQLWYPEVEE